MSQQHAVVYGQTEGRVPKPLLVNGKGELNIGFGDGAHDAFARLRISEPVTLFDSQIIADKQILHWSEKITDGGGSPTSVHSTVNSSVTLTVGASGDKITRRTKRYFHYQPAKSQLWFGTSTIGGAVTNLIRRVGYFDDDEGMFFEMNGSTMYTVVRKNGVDTKIAQSLWGEDKLDGSGTSGFTVDPTKTQILVIDFEALYTGTVRFGMIIGGHFIYCNSHHHANVLGSTYISNANLPISYEIESSGGAGSLEVICTSLQSEGGQQDVGISRYHSTNGDKVDANVIGTIYAVAGIKLKTTHRHISIKLDDISALALTSDPFEWLLIHNPVVAGTFTFTSLDVNSAVEVAKGATANVVTLNTTPTSNQQSVIIKGGYVNTGGDIAQKIKSTLSLGCDIEGTMDSVVLCVRPLGSNLDIHGGINFTEI